MKEEVASISLALVVLILASACESESRNEQTTEIAVRQPTWAKALEITGVPNLFMVSSNLYRSAQPTEAGMKNIKKQGLNTIVNLRSFNSDRDEIGDTNLQYEHIYMKAWHPEEKEVVRFLKIVSDPKRTPVLVHCMHGSDRTGTMSAIYRIAIQGWSKEDAINEMVQGGYGFHKVYSSLAKWINELDIEKIKVEAGIVNKPEAFMAI